MTPRVKWKRGHDMSTNQIIGQLISKWLKVKVFGKLLSIAIIVMTYLLCNYDLRQSYNLSISLLLS
jgi:hypothetical protein